VFDYHVFLTTVTTNVQQVNQIIMKAVRCTKSSAETDVSVRYYLLDSIFPRPST